MSRKVLVLSFLVVLLLAACSGTASPTPAQAPAAPSPAPTDTAVPPSPAPTETAAPVATEVITPTVTEVITPTASVEITPTTAIAMTPTASILVTSTAEAVVTSTTPEEGGIPPILHTLAGRDNCLLCHGTGGSAETVPADHAGRTNETCQGCHKPAAAEAQPTMSVPPGDPAAGQKLFATAGCSGCHSTEPDKKIVGPSLAGIALDAADSVKEPEYKGKAKDAAGWLLESIVSPNVDVPEGFAPNVMPHDFSTKLTTQQLDDLVAYLLTLK